MPTASMQIDGGWLTGIARDLMREGQHDKAAALLYDGLDGIQWDQVYAILRGEAKLVGTNTLDLEPDEDPEYVEALQDVYGGRFEYEGRWWVAYKVVASLGGLDARWSLEQNTQRNLLLGFSRSTPARANHAQRLSFYAHPEDLVAQCSDYLAAICCPSQPPPAWLGMERAPKLSPKEVVDWSVAWASQSGKLDTPNPRDDLQPPYAHSVENSGPDPWERAYQERSFITPRGDALDAEAERFKVSAMRVREAVLSKSSLEVTLSYTDRAGQARTVRIPKEPLDQWALARLGLGHLANPWEAVAPGGFKMTNDSPYHSDWCCGATVEGKEDDPLHVLTDYADAFTGPSPLQDAAHNYAFELASNFRDYKAHILNVGKSGEGRVVQPEPGERVPPGSVVVLPHLGVEFSEVALCEPLAIIAGKGGPLAHLAVVGREKHLTILRIPGAASTFLTGMRVTLDADTGEVVILEA